MGTTTTIYSISGRVSSIAANNGITTVTIDSTAHGNVPPVGVNGPLNNFFYGPGQITPAEMATLTAASTSGNGVTVYFQLTGEGSSVTAVRTVAEQAITTNQNMLMCGGSRWSPKGICYQPVDGSDPLSDANYDTLKSLFDPNTEYGLYNLGINCIRVYQVDPTASHDKVMQLLANNGVYVLVGAVTSTACITTQSTSVPANVIQRVKDVADTFSKYNNVMGYDISNELLDSSSPSEYGLVSLVKQLKSIMQNYMAGKSYRAIPIGCCLRDDPSYTFPASSAYCCGDQNSRMDFIGYNTYRWVVANGQAPSSSTLNAYYELYSQFSGFPVPVMLTEIGAACTGGRGWSQIPYIYGQQQVTSVTGGAANMADAISGCFAFRYYERGQGFGLVQPAGSADPTACDGSNGYGGYDALSAAYFAVPPFTGKPNGVSKVSCSSLTGNPYAGNNPAGGLPAAITATLTNNINNPPQGRTIAFSYSTVANPGPNDWTPAVTIAPLGPSQQFTFPQGTTAISMAYQDGGSWYQGCQLSGANLLAITNNCTIQGQWMAPGGNGSCQVS